jgi:5-oxopent-3-ene-1,2,5-tricarboxylate decarboxylase/2-hydroxyhepta-2,4-diene-1,7-dioate isomerase
LYIKSRNCLTGNEAVVPLPAGIGDVEIAATIGLLIGRDACKISADKALDFVAAACLAFDLTEAHESFYRPSVRQRCRDSFLPLGALAPFDPGVFDREIITEIDGAGVHGWRPSRLVRDPARLIADVSAFMTLAAGDLLLIGLPHDATRVRSAHAVRARVEGLPALSINLSAERPS